MLLLPVVIVNLVGSNAVKPGGKGSIVATPILTQILQNLKKDLRGDILSDVDIGYPL